MPQNHQRLPLEALEYRAGSGVHDRCPRSGRRRHRQLTFLARGRSCLKCSGAEKNSKIGDILTPSTPTLPQTSAAGEVQHILRGLRIDARVLRGFRQCARLLPAMLQRARSSLARDNIQCQLETFSLLPAQREHDTLPMSGAGSLNSSSALLLPYTGARKGRLTHIRPLRPRSSRKNRCRNGRHGNCRYSLLAI